MSSAVNNLRRIAGGGAGLILTFVLACAQAQASDDWDWDAIGGLDDAPVMPDRGRDRVDALINQAPPQPAENAFPDFAAAPHSAHTLFVGMPAFEVIPSQQNPNMHPCSNCHQWVKGNPEPRKLQKPHDDFELEHGLHGKGRFWCFTCHDLNGKGGLKTLEGDPLDFADAYLLCSQCHADKARDWVYGAHGKRVSNWQGPRQVYSCTACHYQHRPGFKPREPQPGPVVRIGLERPGHWVGKDKRENPGEEHRAEWEMGDDGRQQAAPAAGQHEERVSKQEQRDGGQS
jgi:hypothetical protein